MAPPSAPVLLVPGWLRGAKELLPLAERLVRDGWPEDWVFPLDFRDPVGSNLDHAVEIEEAIAALQARTGRPLVDVIAHSMGGLALWALLQRDGDVLPIRRVVFLGSPLQGTLIAHLAWGEGGEEMRPGSDFLKELEAGPDPSHWVEALTIRTPLDLTVVPNRGGTLPGMGDRLICCPTHQGLQDHEETFVLARDFLLYGRGGGNAGDSGLNGRK
jgi:triacylglycerol lipase